MSATSPVRPVLPPDIRARKGGAPLVVLTAYSTPVARLVDAHCDVVLVGDSVGMVIHGLPSTLGVTMEMMILHGRAVVRGAAKAMPVIDMPFGSYEEGPQRAFRNASRLMAETGAVEAAGAFSVVLEKVPEGLAGKITAALAIPTIGIGAGVDCDGQVLVVDDMLGLFTDFRPKFVKRYAELGKTADEAIAAYAAEVRSRAFPAAEHSFPDVLPVKK
jgi:3-methyl-2-oxobutanoate hydroxymethyltransferase